MKLETISKRVSEAPAGKAIGPYEIDIAQIRQDPTFQVRRRLDEANLNRLRGAYRSGAEVSPITLAFLDEATSPLPVIIDGHHRVTVLETMAQDAIRRGDRRPILVKAFFMKLGTAEGRWRAASANGAHGAPLKGAEVRAMFRRFVEAGHHKHSDGHFKSYREIGREIGKTHPTIMSWMQGDFPLEARQMGNEEMAGKVGGEGAPAPLVLAKHKAREALSTLTRAHERAGHQERQEMIDWLWATLEDMERVQTRTNAFDHDMALADEADGPGEMGADF